ncbi:MAG TPA: aminoacyl-tRNA hydrolase [Candidatus Hydrogenedentes bacterium]|nr:aminoacyl-tRNA hydrolase [Candidatus Hydrogenedentota bacterium]HPG68555.1 aminoacyl-tRNA hydrolase [Candidatus Hydrogenedentota bacterium]
MKIVVGLGNPGSPYGRTRHNVGFRVLDCLAAQLGVDFDREKYHGLVSESVIDGVRVLMVKPLTFMNASGDCVARVVRNNTESVSDDLLVIADDVNLPLGKIRIRRGGSAGGHNGLKSIGERIGTTEFPRLRLGVGRNEVSDGLIGHVLGRFRPDEAPMVEDMVALGAEAVVCVVRDGLDRAMNRFN